MCVHACVYVLLCLYVGVWLKVRALDLFRVTPAMDRPVDRVADFARPAPSALRSSSVTEPCFGDAASSAVDALFLDSEALLSANAALICEIANASIPAPGQGVRGCPRPLPRAMGMKGDLFAPQSEPDVPIVGETQHRTLNTPNQIPHRRVGPEYLFGGTLEAELLNIDALIRAKIATLKEVGDDSKAFQITALERIHAQLRSEIPLVHEQLGQQIKAAIDNNSGVGDSKDFVEENSTVSASADDVQAETTQEASIGFYGAALEECLLSVVAKLQEEILRLKDSHDESKADQIAALELIDAQLFAQVSQIQDQLGQQVEVEVAGLAGFQSHAERGHDPGC